jgi:phosphohistidine phosphatase SixA
MLIGHNPGLGALAVELAEREPQAASMQAKYPTGALASFRVEGAWDRLSPRTATLERFVPPKLLS